MVHEVSWVTATMNLQFTTASRMSCSIFRSTRTSTLSQFRRFYYVQKIVYTWVANMNALSFSDVLYSYIPCNWKLAGKVLLRYGSKMGFVTPIKSWWTALKPFPVRPSFSDALFMDRLGRWLLLLSISGALALLFVQRPGWSLPKFISSNIFLKENANATLRTWNSTPLAATPEATAKSSTVTSPLSTEFLATPTVRTTTTFFAKNLSYPVRP